MLFRLSATLLRHWRLVLFVPVGVALLVAFVSFVVPSRFRATTSFLPVGRQVPELPAALAGVASQFLPGIGGTDGARAPGYYIEVLESREIMMKVLERPYRLVSGDSTTLLDWLVPRARTVEDQVDRGLRKLRDATSASADNQTGIIRLGVELRDRVLAAQVANAFVVELNAFNLQTSKEQARQRRVFVEERRSEVAGELQEAEDSLRAFQRANRLIQGSPDLEFEYARLQRRMQMVEETYLTLSRAYENMRVEEANDVAAITLVDPAVPPVRRSFPARRMWVIVAGLVAFTSLVTALAMIDRINELRLQAPRDWGSLTQAWRGATGRLPSDRR